MSDVELWLRVDGRPLRQYGAWGDLTFSTAWPGGSKECSWSMSVPVGTRLPVLHRGATVEVFLGPWRLWLGYLSEPDWNGTQVSLTANGLSRKGETYQAFDSGFAATFNPTTAINAAPDLGWTIGAGVPNYDLATSTTQLFTISGLLDAHAQQIGQRWQVDAYGVVTMAADPQSPQGPNYLIRQGSGDLGIADDNYASNVILRYTRTDNTTASAVYPSPVRGGSPSSNEQRYGHSEYASDITDRGPLADATVAGLAQAVYMRSFQRPGWTNGLELAHGEILTPGWVPVHPALVTANTLARKLGTADEIGLTSYTDFVVGETQYADGQGTVSVSPVALASRSQEDVLTELLESMFPDSSTI